MATTTQRVTITEAKGTPGPGAVVNIYTAPANAYAIVQLGVITTSGAEKIIINGVQAFDMAKYTNTGEVLTFYIPASQVIGWNNGTGLSQFSVIGVEFNYS